MNNDSKSIISTATVNLPLEGKQEEEEETSYVLLVPDDDDNDNDDDKEEDFQEDNYDNSGDKQQQEEEEEEKEEHDDWKNTSSGDGDVDVDEWEEYTEDEQNAQELDEIEDFIGNANDSNEKIESKKDEEDEWWNEEEEEAPTSGLDVQMGDTKSDEEGGGELTEWKWGGGVDDETANEQDTPENDDNDGEKEESTANINEALEDSDDEVVDEPNPDEGEWEDLGEEWIDEEVEEKTVSSMPGKFDVVEDERLGHLTEEDDDKTTPPSFLDELDVVADDDAVEKLSSSPPSATKKDENEIPKATKRPATVEPTDTWAPTQAPTFQGTTPEQWMAKLEKEQAALEAEKAKLAMEQAQRNKSNDAESTSNHDQHHNDDPQGCTCPCVYHMHHGVMMDTSDTSLVAKYKTRNDRLDQKGTEQYTKICVPEKRSIEYKTNQNARCDNTCKLYVCCLLLSLFSLLSSRLIGWVTAASRVVCLFICFDLNVAFS